MWTPHRPDPHTVDRLVLRPGCAVGRFDCGPDSLAWRRPNLIGGAPMVVFPSTAVEIRHEGGPSRVANPNVVMFYNDGQRYDRRLLDPSGDHCVHFAVRAAVFAEIAAEHDPSRSEVPGRPFPFDRGPGDARTWLLHHEIVRELERSEVLDDLWLEESVLELCRAVVGLAFAPADRPARREATTARHREAARHLEELLALRPEENVGLGDLSDAVGLSPFHAARVFRRHTGHSLHGYRTHLRLKTALTRLAGSDDLTDLALDLGFSSHAHFTDQFRRLFGEPPSRLRGRGVRAREREIDRRLERARS